MAGNLGNATQLYAFAVDATLPLPGSGSTAAWFSGWHKWAVIAGAGALGLLLLAALSAGCCMKQRSARQVPSSPQLYPCPTACWRCACRVTRICKGFRHSVL